MTFGLMTVTNNPTRHIKKILILQQHQCTGQGCVICEVLEISQIFKLKVSIYAS